MKSLSFVFCFLFLFTEVAIAHSNSHSNSCIGSSGDTTFYKNGGILSVFNGLIFLDKKRNYRGNKTGEICIKKGVKKKKRERSNKMKSVFKIERASYKKGSMYLKIKISKDILRSKMFFHFFYASEDVYSDNPPMLKIRLGRRYIKGVNSTNYFNGVTSFYYSSYWNNIRIKHKKVYVVISGLENATSLTEFTIYVSFVDRNTKKRTYKYVSVSFKQNPLGKG